MYKQVTDAVNIFHSEPPENAKSFVVKHFGILPLAKDHVGRYNILPSGRAIMIEVFRQEMVFTIYLYPQQTFKKDGHYHYISTCLDTSLATQCGISRQVTWSATLKCRSFCQKFVVFQIWCFLMSGVSQESLHSVFFCIIRSSSNSKKM